MSVAGREMRNTTQLLHFVLAMVLTFSPALFPPAIPRRGGDETEGEKCPAAAAAAPSPQVRRL